MCGISGIYSFLSCAPKVNFNELKKISNRMQSRGPDNKGIWLSENGRVGFAHNRLSIIDLSEKANQPMISRNNRFQIIFNGEIYNAPSIRKKLINKGHCFNSQSDTEVILKLYEINECKLLNEINGMFAFAIWDNKKNSIFLARDHFGIKPLYYFNDGWTFKFASQVNALRLCSNITNEIDPAGLVGFHLWGHVPEPFTIYSDIRSLPSGHYMRIDSTGPSEPLKYWDHSDCFFSSRKNISAKNPRKQIIREIKQSIQKHLISDVDVGVFLSSGIDSSAILGVMNDLEVSNKLALTISFEDFKNKDEDETQFAGYIANYYGANHVVEHYKTSQIFEFLPKIFDDMDQPSIDGINTWLVSKALKNYDIKVALSGIGADELFGGYSVFKDIPSIMSKFSLLSKIPGLNKILRTILRRFANEFLSKNPKSAYIFDYASTIQGAYLLKRGLFMPNEIKDIFNDNFFKEGMIRLSPFLKLKNDTINSKNSQSIISILEYKNYLKDRLLRDADWAGMAHSVEIRTPFVDKILYENVAPHIQNIGKDEGKKIIALAPKKPMPFKLKKRAKTGFEVPIKDLLKHKKISYECKYSKDFNFKGLHSRDWAINVLKSKKINFAK